MVILIVMISHLLDRLLELQGYCSELEFGFFTALLVLYGIAITRPSPNEMDHSRISVRVTDTSTLPHSIEKSRI